MVSASAVLEQIESSFRTLAYPGDENIVYDNSEEHLECLEIRQVFQGKHWSEISRETLVKQNSSLSFFTPAAFRFYLPAYLSTVVKEFDESELLPEVIVHYLTLPAEIDDLNKLNFFLRNPNQIQSDLTQFLIEELSRSNQKIHRFIERVLGFDSEQSKAVRYYLEYLNVDHADYFLSNEPQIAIDRYWFVF